jgi:hypothetical protein
MRDICFLKFGDTVQTANCQKTSSYHNLMVGYIVILFLACVSIFNCFAFFLNCAAINESLANFN